MSKPFDGNEINISVFWGGKRDIRMELGNRIKELRKAQNINQDELAEKLFVSRQTISNWENDKSYPDIQAL